MDFKSAINISLFVTLVLCVCLYLQSGLVKPIDDPWFVPIVVALVWTASIQ